MGGSIFELVEVYEGFRDGKNEHWVISGGRDVCLGSGCMRRYVPYLWYGGH